jgi:tRNA G18 (ribose-2'-O)-methylase SpoU
MMQIQGDFNFGTVVRNANAFGAREAFYYGPRKKWDRRSAVGTYHYTKVSWIPESEGLGSILELKETYPTFVGVDILPGISSCMEEYAWKPGTLMIFGEERRGLSPEMLDICDDVIHITQRGSVRSINVGTAAGIAMFDFGRNYEKKHNA